MSSASHAIRKTDNALKAFFVAQSISGLTTDNVVRTKETTGKTLPLLICNTESAERQRSKNWKVTGSLLLKTDPSTDDNEDNLTISDALEDAVLETIETLVPADDRPQPVADAITAAAVAAGVVDSTEFMMTTFQISRIATGFDEDEIWTLSVDFTATVIA